VALSRENRRDLTQWMLPRFVLPLVVIAVVLGTLLLRVLDIEEEARLSSLRRERSELHHRIRQEECVIAPLNDTIRHRINARDDVAIPLCTSFELLPDLQAKLERLDRQLEQSGG
jgi:hypothetical protein